MENFKCMKYLNLHSSLIENTEKDFIVTDKSLDLICVVSNFSLLFARLSAVKIVVDYKTKAQ